MNTSPAFMRLDYHLQACFILQIRLSKVIFCLIQFDALLISRLQRSVFDQSIKENTLNIIRVEAAQVPH